mmetsp:Transcript_23136/g.20055  ORF Transcript_23136/g.20055 Transcript_23136/m.20055 type:complete len:89 (+) Transcript_23136:239-505(+)
MASILKKAKEWGQYMETSLKIMEKYQQEKNFVELFKIYDEIQQIPEIDEQKKNELSFKIFEEHFEFMDYNSQKVEDLFIRVINSNPSK